MRLQNINCKRIGTNVLQCCEDVVHEKHHADNGNVGGHVRDEEHRAQNNNHPALSNQNPRPTFAHFWELEAINDWPPQEFDRPW